MREFTKSLGVLLAVMLISTLMSAQSASEMNAHNMQFIQKQYQDVVPGIKPVTTPLSSNFDYTGIVTSDGTKGILYDNGGFITRPGMGSNGSDYSDLQVLGLGMTTLGTGVQISLGNTIADNFEVPETWYLTNITFYAYQTGSDTISTIKDVRYQIYDGDPSAGGIVIYSDMATNQLVSTEWTNVWRVADDSQVEDRPIMAIVANAVGCVLTSGTYWIEWQASGTLSSGPWAPPITILGETTTGDALKYDGSDWTFFVDGGTLAPQGIPFIIEGTVGAPPQNDMAVISIIEPKETVEVGMKDLTIKLKNNGETSQSNFDVSFSINGGAPVTETVSATVAYLETYEYTFTTQADLSAMGTYELEACVALTGDETPDNDCISKTVDAKVWYPTALEFDGTDQYVQTTYPGVMGNNPRTLMAWIYLDEASSGTRCIMDYGENSPYSRNTFMVNGSGYLSYLSGGSGSGITADVASVPVGEWVSVALVYDGSNAFLYQNGEQVGTKTFASGINTSTGGENFKIGQRVAGGSIPFNGIIDAIGIWDVALTQQEVIDYACIGNPLLYENLLAYYNFGDGSGTILTDQANGKNGTLMNMDEEDWVESDVCTYGHNVTFVITSGGTIQIEDAAVNLDGEVKYTNGNGEVTFDYYEPGTYDYTVSKDGYYDQSGTVEVVDEDVTAEVDLLFTGMLNKESVEVSVYPNPTDGIVHISLADDNGCKVVVNDISGRIIDTFELSNSNETIDLSGVQEGIYFLEIQMKNKVVTLPLVVK